MIGFFKRLWYRWQYSDVISILLLLGLSLYLTRLLLDWNNKALWSDLTVSSTWLYWLKKSLFTFHQFPTWSPLWMGGMPFFGMVPPAAFFLVLPLYLITGSAPAAYNLGMIIMFLLAGVSMYLYLKHLSKNSLVSFLGAVIYIILPVHTSAIMLWGLFEISCAYAVAPLVLLFTERFLERKAGVNLLLLSLSFCFVSLSQIEHAFLFLLFFFLPYLIFTLFFKKIGPKQLLDILKKNKVWVIVALLVLLIPLSFYIPLLSERSNFTGLLPHEIEAGIHHYTFKHFSDPFLAKAVDYLDTWRQPATEHYCGPLSFVILVASMLFVILEKDRRRVAQLLFFLLMGFAFLLLSMGVYGPLFPLARGAVPVLYDMRVPLRFYPFFALCLPILFTLSSLSFFKSMVKIPRISIRAGSIVSRAVPILVVIGLMLDFIPYFDFYHHRVMDRGKLYECRSFLEENISEDNLPEGNIARVLVYPLWGLIIDRMAAIQKTDGGQFVIEITQTSLAWNQYKETVDYHFTGVFDSITEDEDHLSFYSNLLSIDYILVYTNKVPPVSGEEYLNQKVETLDSFCGDESQPLLYKGSLDTEYYTIHLYEIKDTSDKARFYPVNDSLFISNGDLYASQTLFQMYQELKGDSQSVAARDFLNKVVAIHGDEEYLVNVLPKLVSAENLRYYEGKIILLPDDPSAVLVMEAEDCGTKGWAKVDREGGWGIPTSGVDMAVPDVTQVEDNYLKKRFIVGKEGNWILNISYLTYVDTGKMEIYVDDKLINTVDTYGSALAQETYTAQLFLNEGWHEIRLVGKKSDRDITTGSKGNWVEVDRIVLQSQEEVPQIAPTSDVAQISNFKLSPRGISLDIDAAEDGILSVAYYFNPWWRVYVDGKETEVLKVNGIYSGCYVGKGQHQIRFIYNYPSPVNLFSLLPR